MFSQVLLHDPAEEPQMKDLAFTVSPGSHTLATIKHTKVLLLCSFSFHISSKISPASTVAQELKLAWTYFQNMTCLYFYQTINLGEPYDSCKTEVETDATCNQREAEKQCGCQDELDGFRDNGTLPHCDVFGMLCVIKRRGKLNFL